MVPDGRCRLIVRLESGANDPCSPDGDSGPGVLVVSDTPWMSESATVECEDPTQPCKDLQRHGWDLGDLVTDWAMESGGQAGFIAPPAR